MTKTEDQIRFENRLLERTFWYKMGRRISLSSLGIATIFIVILFMNTEGFLPLFFLDIEQFLLRVMITFALSGALIGTLLSNLGWAKSKWIDFLLNRLASILLFIGIGLESLIILPQYPVHIAVWGRVIIIFLVIPLLLIGRYFTPPYPPHKIVDEYS